MQRETNEKNKNNKKKKNKKNICWNSARRVHEKVLHQLVADGIMRTFQRINAIAESQFLDSDSLS